MANTDLIVPLVVATIGLLGTIVSLVWSWYVQERTRKHDEEMGDRADKQAQDLEVLRKQHECALAEYKTRTDQELEAVKVQIQRRKVADTLTEKYSQPLLVAAYDLQHRLYELVEYPISRQHVTTKEGVEDLKIFSCYLLAQYLVYAYILRTKTGYLSFNHDKGLKHIRSVMYMIDQELDQRRDEVGDGTNVGVWPGARVIVADRMIVEGSKREVNELMDGGFGMEVKGYDQFYKEWAKNFQQPMGFFCKWIDDMLEGRLRKKNHGDAAIRCLQHLMLDLIAQLDSGSEKRFGESLRNLKCTPSTRGCDCSDCSEEAGNIAEILKKRQDSRLVENGLWSVHGLQKGRQRGAQNGTDRNFDLSVVKAMTIYANLD